MQAVEMALEAALVVMRNGGSTSAANRCFTHVLEWHGQQGVVAVWRLDFIAATRTVEGTSSTVVRSVGPIGVNLARVSEMVALGERAARKEVDTASFLEELERIQRLTSPHGRGITMLVAACTAACFARLVGGDWGSAGIAFAAGGIGQSLRSLLQARKLDVATVMLVSGVLSTLIASAGLRLGFSQAVPATLMASVAYMIPGLPLINGFVDVASHEYLLVGIERMVKAAFLFLVLAIAIAFSVTLVR